MEVPHLSWNEIIYEDPEGGKIVIWPHLPCIRMPSNLRYRNWNGLALLYSSDDIMLSKEEEKEEIKSPGMNVQAVIASGSMMSMMLKDIQNLEVDGPRIPDPEPMRLMMHAKNSENKSVYSIIPTIEDEEWADWEGRWAHNQAKVMNLLSTLTRSRRYSKNRIKAASRVQKAENINSELGAAAASCASWWMESQRGIPREMMEERDIRFASRVRGALADLRNRRVDDSDSSDLVLLVPVHQAHLVQFANAIKKCETIEKIEME